MPVIDDERRLAIGVEQDHLELAAVAGVDQTRRVDDRDAVAVGKSGARLHEARVALGDRDGQSRADDGALARSELHALACGEIEPRIAP